MPVTLNGLNNTPRSDTMNAVGAGVQFGPLTDAASQANTAIQSAYISPVQYKIRKVAVYFSAITAVGTTISFNLVVGTGAYTQGSVAANDNSFDPTSTTTVGVGGTFSAQGAVLGGVGYPTNVAVVGNAVFSADVTISTTNFPNATTTGGYGILIPTNYDAVYPAGIPLTLRATTPASNTITNFTIGLAIVPMRLRVAPPGAEAVAPLPGVDF